MTHNRQEQAYYDLGYNTALMDTYLFLSDDPAVFDIKEDDLNKIKAMVTQAYQPTLVNA